VLSIGTRSGRYEDSVDFPASAAQQLSDGTWEYDIQLDRARDQYLRMRGYNEAGYSPLSNEIRVPRLGATTASAASAPAAAQASALSASASAPPETPSASLAAAVTSAREESADASASLAANATPPTDEPLRSVDLDGDAEQLAATRDARPTAAGFTLALWAKASPSAVGRRGLLHLTCAGSPCGFAVALGDPLDPSLELLRADARGAWSLVRRIPAAGAVSGWWHLALSVDAARELASLYVDGELLASEAATIVPPEILAGEPVRIVLGAPASADTTGWAGRLGHAAWFDRALDAGEIAALALGGHELDLRDGSLAPSHYWRLGADSSAVGRDFAAGTLPLDDPLGGVDAADIAIDAPLARTAEEDASGQ
jgi:hypothetical protein